MERFDIDNEGNIIISRGGLYVDADEASAEIERLEKEVEALKVARDMLGRFWDKAKQEADTSWNDAIEAAAARIEAMGFTANFIRALKRPTQNAPSVEFKSTRTDEAKAADRRAAEEGSKG